MRASSNPQLRNPPDLPGGSGADQFAQDPYWRLAQSVAAGPHFERSPLLSKFLLYVVAETLAGRQSSISEHKIGVAVFGRPHTYRTDQDNIVRNYARQLRRRLSEHFAGVGRDEPTRIEIPIGGYVPAFVAGERLTATERAHPPAEPPALYDHHPDSSPRLLKLWPTVRRALLALVLVVLIAGVYWSLNRWPLVRASSSDPARILWHAILPQTGTVYVVPSDAGFTLMEDMSHRRLPLDDYIRGSYEPIDPGGLNAHTRQDLSSQRYTDLVSLKIIASLARQPEFDPQRVQLRFPRDVRIDDLKTANALIIGSANSNPWAALGDAKTNFRIVPRENMDGAAIINAHPLAGEQTSYQSHWNEPSHDTYALILFVPNLSGAGHLWLIEGLDVAGTEAAADALFHPESISAILERARRSDGTLRPFEILLHTTSIQSNAAGTQVLAARIG
ncbi:hypothetical protein DYQ86_11970 [Acidobacteria bacterium AB60]|nr:hypothetical protein DYQ86_11970 [Acidobacteria bacterium AB60]